MVEFLVKQGVDPEVRDRWGQTPLDDARRGNHPTLVSFLERASNSMAETLCRAAFRNDVEEIRSLAAGGLDLNKRDYGTSFPSPPP